MTFNFPSRGSGFGTQLTRIGAARGEKGVLGCEFPSEPFQPAVHAFSFFFFFLVIPPPRGGVTR